MQVTATSIQGCYELVPASFNDNRGRFVKTYDRQTFLELGLQTEWQESFYSVSRKGVLRGMHFQLPPHDHEKLVFCTDGEILDAVVDLRRNSETYGCHVQVRLSSKWGNLLYIPRGFAHGFYVTSQSATVMYQASTVHAPDYDAGILWNSAGILWPDTDPVMSSRDLSFPTLETFVSPFN